MDYATTYLQLILRFYESKIQLFIGSDAAYFVLPNARSRIAGYFYLSDIPPDNLDPKLNTPILVVYKILKM